MPQRRISNEVTLDAKVVNNAIGDSISDLLVSGGPLGTPSSGTVTNLTGTASININGTVGATTPSTGAFTTVSATGNLTVDTNTLFVDSTNDSVMIGSTTNVSPYSLYILRASAGGVLVRSEAANTNAQIRLEAYASSGTPGGGILNLAAHGGTVASPSATPSGSSLAQIQFKGYGDAVSQTGGGVYATAGSLWSATNYETKLGFNVTASASTTSTERLLINSSGTIKMSAYGAGTATFDSAGLISSVSDERAKDNLAPFAKGLAVVRAATPQSWNWKKETGLTPGDFNVGLTAQQLINAGAPEAVFDYRTVPDEEAGPLDSEGQPTQQQKKDAHGKLLTKRVPAELMTVSRDAEIAILWNAVKDLADENDLLKTRVAALEAQP